MVVCFCDIELYGYVVCVVGVGFVMGVGYVECVLW